MRRIGITMTLASVLAATALSACGGGGSSSDGVVFQGTLTERGEGHSSAVEASLKHSAGERIGEVKVCVQGECSITDDNGQWGVQVSEFSGGDVAVTLDGHGITASVTTNIPSTAREVEIDIDHAGNEVSIAKLLIDGEDHTGHDHDHNDGHSHSK